MVAFYKEVCIIYGAEHPLHILWLYNFISGLVAQLGERSVRIREVVGSNPIRSTKLTKRYRCVWRKARRINRFRAFSGPDSFFQTIDANRCFRASALI